MLDQRAITRKNPIFYAHSDGWTDGEWNVLWQFWKFKMRCFSSIAGACLGLLLATHGASAQTTQASGQSNITLNGMVNQFCVLPPPTSTGGAGSFTPNTGNDATITLVASEFVNAATGMHRSLSMTLTYPQAVL
jgi:hypothetical protein